jgi:hypothetical protein
MQVHSNRIKGIYFEYYKTFAPLGSIKKRIEREIEWQRRVSFYASKFKLE